ncbi:MAG: hypothetical protein ABJA18_11645 [bacterium]
MKLAFRSQCAITALMLVFGAFSLAQAQTTSATPDPFVVQVTSSPQSFYSFAGDLTANGRFVVFESNGDVATEKIPSKNPDGTPNPNARNNEDGNREIFLIDYAQRRIFQITNTKNVQKPPASPTPTPTPTPTPSPTPTPLPVPPDLSQVKIEISNNHPMISFEPALVSGKRIYTIVFSSNAPNPANFDGTDSPALVADGNQEIWICQLPEIDDVFDLSSGDEIPLTGNVLTTGTFRQITDTPPSRPLRTGVFLPDVLDDNREATISDDGNTLAFISNRNLVPPGNAEPFPNPELFLVRTTNFFAPGSNTYVQGTNTQDVFVTPKTYYAVQQNPSLSANGSVVAFLSSANLAGGNDDTGHTNGNEEVFVANFSGSALTNFRQATRTKNVPNLVVNVLSPGRRLSRDGALIALESLMDDPKANTTPTQTSRAIFVYNIAADTFVKVGPRAEGSGDFGFLKFPTFTDYNSSLAPSTLVFGSALNFKADGTFPAADQASTGLNPQNQPQIFSTQIPATSSNTFTRLTKNPVGGFGLIRPLTSQTRARIAFSLAGSELGGGNPDGSSEIFFLLTPTATPDQAVLAFSTGASNMGPFASANPNASPTPTPAPSPSPGDPAGLAPGELSIVRSTVGLANSDKAAVGGSETARSPILPVELNGVSVSVNGAAAGLYFVGASPADGIRFVVPIGVSTGVATVVINNRGTVFRGFVQIVASQPDIFNPPTNGPAGTAMVCNVTNTAISGCVMGPFQVTTADSTGTQVPTKLEIYLTGVRSALIAETKVSFVNGTTTTDIIPTSVRPNTNMFGQDLINITLPASLAGAAPIDYKLIVTVTRTSVFTSRPVATASQVTIIP